MGTHRCCKFQTLSQIQTKKGPTKKDTIIDDEEDKHSQIPLRQSMSLMIAAQPSCTKGVVSNVRGAAASLMQAGVKARSQMEEWSLKSTEAHAHALCSLTFPPSSD